MPRSWPECSLTNVGIGKGESLYLLLLPRQLLLQGPSLLLTFHSESAHTIRCNSKRNFRTLFFFLSSGTSLMHYNSSQMHKQVANRLYIDKHPSTVPPNSIIICYSILTTYKSFTYSIRLMIASDPFRK